MNPVLNKKENYRLWQSGAFGNKLRAWRTVDEWCASGFTGSVSLRYVGPVVGGCPGPCLYDVEPADVASHLDELVRQGFHRSDLMINESAPNSTVIMQGEYLNELWGGLYYSRAKVKMRSALRLRPEGAVGLRARLLLREVMTPASYEDWQQLITDYPNHVLEVSIYDRCLGDLPHRNALVWEVRRY